MVAEITKRMVPKWVAKCDECDVFLATILRPADSYLQGHVDRHNRYCHSDELLPHTIAHTSSRGILGGWVAECICGYSSNWNGGSNSWECPLDRTLAAV